MSDIKDTPHPRVGDGFEAMDARIRHKLDMDLALTDEERAFFADMPGIKELSPAEVQRRGAAGEQARHHQ